jgi:hypothetical protein
MVLSYLKQFDFYGNYSGVKGEDDGISKEEPTRT